MTVLALPAPGTVLSATDPSLIVLGTSIGPIRLGMTRLDVVRHFGKPVRSERFDFASGEHGRLAHYRKRGGFFRITYVAGDVVGISASSTFYRTSGGVGPGSPLGHAARLPGFHFDQCSAGYIREHAATLSLIVGYTGELGDPVRHVSIFELGYLDC